MIRPLMVFTNAELTTMLGKLKAQLIAEGEDAVVSWHDGAHGEQIQPIPISRQIENVCNEMNVRGMPMPGDDYPWPDSAKAVL